LSCIGPRNSCPAWNARPTTSTKVELTRHIGPIFISKVVGALDPETVEDPKDSLSQQFFDLSHARYLVRERRSGIEPDQATLALWNRRSCFVRCNRETISSHME
jgi:hypothetical protein